jgi:chromosome segregation ATPase
MDNNIGLLISLLLGSSGPIVLILQALIKWNQKRRDRMESQEKDASDFLQDIAKQDIVELKSRVQKQSENIETLRKENDGLVKSIDSLKIAHEAREKELTQVRNDFDVVKGKAQKFEDENVQLKAEITELRGQLAVEQAKLAEVIKEFEEYKQNH